MNQEKLLAFYQSGAAFWAEMLRAQLQIGQSMFTIGWAFALGARPKFLPPSGPSTASAAVEPPHATAVAKARRARGRRRRTMRAP